MFQLHLTRQIGYHVVQTYIPSTVFVVLGWLSLFIPPESVPGRVGMGMTTLLTLTAMFSSVGDTSLTNFSYKPIPRSARMSLGSPTSHTWTSGC